MTSTLEKVVTFDNIETIELAKGGPSVSLDMARVSVDTINTAALFGFKRKVYNFFNTARGEDPATALQETIKHIESVIYAGLWMESGSRVSRSAPKTFEEFALQRNQSRLVDYLDINSKNKTIAAEAKKHRAALKERGYDPDATSTGERLLVLLAKQNADADQKAWESYQARLASKRNNVNILDHIDGLDMGGNA